MSYFGQTEDAPVTLGEAYWYATGIVLAFAYFMFTYSQFILYFYKISGIIRVACNGLIYRKVLRMSKSSIDGGQIGKIVNLLSNDLRTFDEFLVWVYDLWRGPLEVTAFLIAMYAEVGLAAVIGMGFLMCFIPLQSKTNEIKGTHPIDRLSEIDFFCLYFAVWCGKKAANLINRKAKRTDFRIKVMMRF